MSLVVFEDVSLSFGEQRIVSGLDLRIAEDDRIGMIGPNGSGKSTVLRMIAGEQHADGGSITISRGTRIGYLPQDIALTGGRGLLDFVLSSVPGRADLDANLVAAEAEMAEASATQAGAERMMDLASVLADLHERLAHFETHYSPHQAHRILAGLGFLPEDHDRDLGELSGGWKMRAVLAALLFQRPDLLLLDEPTNHLDMPSVAWFGDFLRRYGRAFILICHDREFMNEQAARIASFESEGVRQYRGNYDAYEKQRAEEEIILENKARNLEREREKAEQFITRFRAQANKAKAVQSRIKALDKMESVQTYQKRKVMTFTFPASGRTGATAVKLEGVKKAYGDRVVFPGLDLNLARGEKIGIIGVNGAGKTTLLRMIAGELGCDAGTIELGHKVVAGYYAQHHAETLDRGQTVFESVASVDPSQGQTRVRSVLGAFLFSGDDVDKSVEVLSGGERARVALARILLKPGNLLLMDEPTNHLDLQSSEALAQSLRSYDGTLLFVSHNRSFVRTLAQKIWNVADGRVEEYPGTLDEYIDSCRRRGDDEASQAVAPSASGKPKPTAEPTRRAKARSEPAPAQAATPKRSRDDERKRKREEAERRRTRNKAIKPLQKRVRELEARIAELEDAQKERSTQLADPAFYEDQAKKSALLGAYQDAAEELERLSDRWEIAAAELEEVEADA